MSADDIDLTVALTAHSETLVAGPTLASAEAAIAEVRRAGYTVERLIGFDTPTPECRAYFAQPAFAAWQASEHAFRDQGRTRNALAARARGRWLAFLDADDLFSENWLIEAIRCLQAAGDDARVVGQFDAATSVTVTPAQDDPFFSPYGLAVTNFYDALCLAPRQAWIEHPFPHRDIEDGYAFEDWQWAIETMVAGWHHAVAPDTVIFKRRRDASQTHQARARAAAIRALDCLRVDRIADLTRPRNPKPAG
jgi:hypothetical protein